MASKGELSAFARRNQKWSNVFKKISFSKSLGPAIASLPVFFTAWPDMPFAGRFPYILHTAASMRFERWKHYPKHSEMI